MRKNTLRKVISALVEEFGHQSVRKILDDCITEAVSKSSIGEPSTHVYNQSKWKRTATNFVKSLEIDDEEKRDILLILAEKYDNSQFMPNANNVRAFLKQQEKDATGIKSRQQAIPYIFGCLADLETQKLSELHRRGLYGTPNSLSVIARSIENAGSRRRLRSLTESAKQLLVKIGDRNGTLEYQVDDKSGFERMIIGGTQVVDNVGSNSNIILYKEATIELMKRNLLNRQTENSYCITTEGRETYAELAKPLKISQEYHMKSSL